MLECLVVWRLPCSSGSTSLKQNSWPLASDSTTFPYTGKRVQDLDLFDLCKSHLLQIQRCSSQFVKELSSVMFLHLLQVVSRHSWLECIDAQQSVILQLLVQASQHCRDQPSSAVTGTVLTPTFSSVRNTRQVFRDASRTRQPPDYTSDIHTSCWLNDWICLNPFWTKNTVSFINKSWMNSLPKFWSSGTCSCKKKFHPATDF